MRPLLTTFLILCVNFAYAKPMVITCDSFVDGAKYAENNFGKDYGFEIGDIWVTSKYTFDTGDFDSPKKEALIALEYYKGLASFGPMEKTSAYTVNPQQIIFDSDAEFPTRIDRKTLEIAGGLTTPYKCRIAEVDTSDNLF